MTPPSATPHADDPAHARRWWILAVLSLAQLMVVLDGTIVNIALPTAQQDIGFSDESRQWVVTAYALAFGSLLLLGGRLGDLFGRRNTFIVGAVGFAAASAVGGMAGSFEVLVGARALQGIFGALLAPAGLSLLTTTFTDPHERGKAFGIYGAIAGAGGGVGLLLGGILTEYLSWRWSLYVNVLIAIPAAVGAWKLLTERRDRARVHIDVPGTIAVTGGLLALVYGFTSAETDGWAAGITVAMFVASAVLLVAFVLIELRVKHPLLPLRVVLDRNRGGAFLGMGIVGIGMFGIFLFLTYYLQQNKGFSPVETGLAFLPMIVALAIAAQTTTGTLVPRIGPRIPMALGMLVGAAGMALLAQLESTSDYVTGVLPGLLVMGVGVGMVMATGMATATDGVRTEDASVASAMVSTVQQVGGSIGTALLSTLFASSVDDFAASNADLGPRLAAEASMHGYTTVFWIAASVLALGALVSAVLLRPGTVEVDPDAAPVLAH